MEFDSAAAILGYIHEKCGAEGLHQVLGMIDSDRDSLQGEAEELYQAAEWLTLAWDSQIR